MTDITLNGLDDLEAAWTIIANAYGGNWESAPDDWRVAAERWRDTVYHPVAAGASAEAAPDDATPTFCSRPDCGLRATGIAPDPDGFRWRPYCSDCMPAAEVPSAEAAPDDGCRAPHCWSEYGTPCATCPKEKR